MNPALLSSKNMCWCTPQDFFDKLNEEFRFVLDPAATEKTAKCPLYYTPETDGLSQSWNRGGVVFCNPPYGSEIGKWVKKAYDEAQKGQTIVLLLPARTDTKYFHDYIYGKAEIRFLRGRLRFTDEDGRASAPAPFPSMIVIYKKKGQCKMTSLNELAKQINENAVAHGWWEEARTFPEIVALIHSELSEALEEYRSNHGVTEVYQEAEKPEGVPIELADAIIRILDYCGYAGIDIVAALERKHEYNKTRPYRHGGKRC